MLDKIKKTIKNGVYALKATSTLELLKIVDDYYIVSFDVFDTLIKRDVTDEKQVFEIVKKRFEKENEICISDFAEKRIKAENLARRNAQEQEITLSEIYSYLDVGEDIKSRLMQLECEIECGICVPNISMSRVYKRCIEKNKKIIFISDMYLPKEIIEKIMEKCGFFKGTLFVSSEYKMQKKTGDLFKCIGISQGEKWLHIGDNIRSDFYMPRKQGISTCLIKKNIINNHYYNKTGKGDINYLNITKFISNRIERYDDAYEIIGYEVLGPLLYAFAEWIMMQINLDEKIFFLAREGKLLQKAYELLTDKVETYLYVSRQAISTALLSEVNTYEEYQEKKICNIQRYPTVFEYCLSCGIHEEDSSKLIEQLGMDREKMIEESEKRKIVNHGIDLISKNGKKQKSFLLQYLCEKGISKTNVLIDVGWNGTMQLEMKTLMEQNCRSDIRFRGLYFGVKQGKYSRYEGMERKGFLFEEGNNKKIENELAYTLPFFELLFLNTEATTCEYEKGSDGKIYPILGEKENSGNEEKCIARIQKAALEFVRDMKENPMSDFLSFCPQMAFLNYEKLAVKVSNRTLALFDKFKVYDGGEYYLTSRKSLAYYMLHIKEFKKDFLNNRCKLWFLKGLIKMPLPYVFMLRLIKKFDTKKE